MIGLHNQGVSGTVWVHFPVTLVLATASVAADSTLRVVGGAPDCSGESGCLYPGVKIGDSTPNPLLSFGLRRNSSLIIEAVTALNIELERSSGVVVAASGSPSAPRFAFYAGGRFTRPVRIGAGIDSCNILTITLPPPSSLLPLE